MDTIVGFQITATDGESTADFYSKVFDWGQAPGPHENVWDLEAGGISGSVIGRGEYIPPYVSLVVAVENLEATIEKITSNGGKIVRPPFTLPNGETLAIAEDPEGYVVTLKA